MNDNFVNDNFVNDNFVPQKATFADPKKISDSVYLAQNCECVAKKLHCVTYNSFVTPYVSYGK